MSLLNAATSLLGGMGGGGAGAPVTSAAGPVAFGEVNVHRPAAAGAAASAWVMAGAAVAAVGLLLLLVLNRRK